MADGYGTKKTIEKVDYSAHAIARRACELRNDDAPGPCDRWGNAAATFRHAARNLDEAGRREYGTYISEALGDASLPSGFRDELRRQHERRPKKYDAGPEPFVTIQDVVVES